MERKLKKNTSLKIVLGILFFVLSFLLFNLSQPVETEAACGSHWCCGTVGTGGCVWNPCSGCASCNCQGSTMYCDRGDCRTCTPPGCPTGYTTTNTGCSTTTTSCTRYYCYGGSCGSSSRTCWLLKYNVYYDANSGSCTPTSRTGICRGGSAAGPSCSRTGYDLDGFTKTSGTCTFTTATGACSSITSDIYIRADWSIKTFLVTYNANGGSCTPTDRTVNYDTPAAAPSCSRVDYNPGNPAFTITSGSCAGSFNSTTGYCSSVTQAMTIRANWVVANSEPDDASGLLVDGKSSPAVVADTTPYFSAIYNDPDTSDYSEQYEIQVNTNSSFTGTVKWASGFTSMTQTGQGQRSPNINYGGSALSLDGSTYYWRIRFADSYSETSLWTTATVGQFTMNRAPATPTYLETEGATDPSCVTDTTPEFTAIYNDPDSHPASQYQIQVNTNSSFTGTTMWDSGLTGGINTASGSRTDPISYDGTALTYNGTTYYWRIRFADEHGTVSPWSVAASFQMNTPPTLTPPTQLLTESQVNPIDIGILDPTFSAIFNDPDTCSFTEYSENYEIEINTTSGFTGSVMWDTGKTPMARTNKGSRSPEITYDGTPLSLNGATYYWRIRMWDSMDSVSGWSNTASFTMETNQTPTAPTALLVNGLTNNPRVNDANPEFSAIFNDPNQYDFSNYYEVEVNTASNFAGTVMWDSGQQFMSTTTQGARSPNITYNGSTLNLEAVTYHWRIRFWDAANAVSPWATGYFTTAGSYATFQDLQLGGLIFDVP